jgi:alkane 1-monooxygenase
MVVAALVTPVWRRIMDPRVLAHYGGDMSLANVHPRAAERLRERYPERAPRSVGGPLPDERVPGGADQSVGDAVDAQASHL